MQELITITTDGQGSSVVSARELHGFLEVKSKFADWIKNRIIKYQFREDEDYITLSKNLESGGKENDYALTLDMAKQLSMVENNQKGKEARQYFINAEKAARALAPAPALPSQTEQMILQLMQQQSQLMSNQQMMLEQLRADMNAIQAGQRPITRRRALPTPAIPPPSPRQLSSDALRRQVVGKVNEYCDRYDVSHSEAYKYLYRRLSLDFRFNVYDCKAFNEKPLDAVERFGYMIPLLSIVDSELVYREE